MVQLTRYLRRTNEFQGGKNLPLLNSLFTERFSKFNSYPPGNNFKKFMRWARRSPQLIGFLNIIATDMLSDKIDFFPLEKGSSGRNKVMKAEAFWRANKGLDVAEETMYDFLIDGIGYNWLAKVSDNQLKEFCDITVREVFQGKEFKELEYKAERMFNLIKQKRNGDLAKKLRHMAASTITIHTDEYEVLKYIQRVGVNTKEYDPDEVIVFKMMPFDGKVFPLPPMEVIFAEIYLLWLITQCNVSFFENGGKPDNVFILPKELAGSKNHKYLIDTLRKYKKIQNKHGNLVFTGDLSIEKLMEVENQMENRDLGLYLISVLAMFYGIPIGRIPFLVGKAASLGDSGGLADSGYWRKISVWQSKFEDSYNTSLWNPYFGVNMKFRRGYLQDEVRETQTEMQKTSIAEQRMGLGLWTSETAGEYLKIDPEEVKKAQAEKKKRDAEAAKNAAKTGMDRQNLEKKKNVLPNPDHKLKAKKKQDKQRENQKNAGGKKVNP